MANNERTQLVTMIAKIVGPKILNWWQRRQERRRKEAEDRRRLEAIIRAREIKAAPQPAPVVVDEEIEFDDCSQCGGSYPIPVELYHSAEECFNRQSASI